MAQICTPKATGGGGNPKSNPNRNVSEARWGTAATATAGKLTVGEGGPKVNPNLMEGSSNGSDMAVGDD